MAKREEKKKIMHTNEIWSTYGRISTIWCYVFEKMAWFCTSHICWLLPADKWWHLWRELNNMRSIFMRITRMNCVIIICVENSKSSSKKKSLSLDFGFVLFFFGILFVFFFNTKKYRADKIPILHICQRNKITMPNSRKLKKNRMHFQNHVEFQSNQIERN